MRFPDRQRLAEIGADRIRRHRIRQMLQRGRALVDGSGNPIYINGVPLVWHNTKEEVHSGIIPAGETGASGCST